MTMTVQEHRDMVEECILSCELEIINIDAYYNNHNFTIEELNYLLDILNSIKDEG